MSNLHAIIMAGGSGTRFWPASRARRPKHFLDLLEGGGTLIGATIDRVTPVVGLERTWIVTNPVLAGELPKYVEGFPTDQVIVESEPRDTAPCVALASAWVEARDPGATMAFLPSDHLIAPQARFHQLLERAAQLAVETDSLITLGIRPSHPATVYGYIEQGEAVDDGDPPAYHVARFREKPDRDTATSFLESGRFHWNSGVFVWTQKALLGAMDAGHPELAASTRAMTQAAQSMDRDAIDRAFASTPKTSVDYAVMENAPRVIMLEADLEWNDLGSFLALDAVAPPDGAGNVVALHGGARALLERTENSTVYGDGEQAVVLMGVRDVVVVAVGDALLVCAKDQADHLKSVVAKLGDAGMADLL